MIQIEREVHKRSRTVREIYPIFFATSVLDYLNHHEEIPPEKWNNMYFFGATIWISRACIAFQERGYRIYDSTGEFVTAPRHHSYTNPFIALEDALSQMHSDLGDNTTLHHKPPREGRYDHVIIRHFSGAQRAYIYGVTEKQVPETHEEDFEMTPNLATQRMRV